MSALASTIGSKYLTFLIEERQYGLSTSHVREIVLNAPFETLPEVPKFVRGLTSIRDEYIPVIDMALLLGSKSTIEVEEASCFIIALLDINGLQTPVALLINEVNHAIQISDQDINSSPVVGDKAQAPYVYGVTYVSDNKNDDSNEICILLDVNGLFKEHLDLVAQVLKDSSSDTSLNNSENNVKNINNNHDETQFNSSTKTRVTKRKKYISISVDQYKFAVPSTMVSQISRSDFEEIKSDYPEFMLTVALIEGKPTGIIKLKDFIEKSEVKFDNDNLEKQKPEKISKSSIDDTNESEVVIVLNMNNVSIGIMVDNVGQAYDIDENDIGSSNFCENQYRKWIKSLGFINTDEGRLEIIDLTAIFSESEVTTLTKWNESLNAIININEANNKSQSIQELDVTEIDAKYEKIAGYYLIVIVGNHLIAIKNTYVREVTKSESILSLPSTQQDFKGILTIRGKAYPVIDLSSRLGVNHFESEDHYECIVLIKDKSKTIGLLASHVVDCRRFTAAEVTSNSGGTLYVHPACLNAVVPSEKGPIHLVNIEEILYRDIVTGTELMSSIKNV